MDSRKYIGMDVHQGMSSEGWCIQWESTPPEQKSEFCSLDSREGRKLNPGSLSTKPSLGWGASHWAVTKVNAQVTPKLFTSEAEPPLIGRRLHGTSQTDRCGGTLWRGGSGSTMTRMHRATGEALLVPARNRRSMEKPYNRKREVGRKARG